MPRILFLLIVLLAACGRAAAPPAPTVPKEMRRVSFDVVARNNHCEPEVLAVDREGRGLLMIFQVTSVGKDHWFVIPDLDVRRRVPAGTRLEIPVVAEHSRIYQYACASSRWLGPLTATGKLAVK